MDVDIGSPHTPVGEMGSSHVGVDDGALAAEGDEEGSPEPGSLMPTFSSGLTPGGRPRGTPGLARTSSLSTPVRSLSSTPGGVFSGGARRVARTPGGASWDSKPATDENTGGPMASLVAKLAAQGKVLKLVEATKEQKALLGSDKVLTPVRASARGTDRDALTPSRGELQRMLSASNFAYVPDTAP